MRLEHVRDGHAELARLGAVDVGVELRHVDLDSWRTGRRAPAPARPWPMNALVACVERLVAEAGAILDLQLEAADGAEPLHRRRREDGDEGVLDARRTSGCSWPAIASRTGPASCAPRRASASTKTMPAFELLVKPLIDRPGKATALCDAGLLRARCRSCGGSRLRCGRAWRRRAAGRSRRDTACPAPARSRTGTALNRPTGDADQDDVDAHAPAPCGEMTRRTPPP